VQLAPGIHLIGSGSGGFDLTDPFDCHVYLVEAGGEAAVVDAGIGRATDAILDAVELAGVGLQAVRYLLLTHAHPDHSGGAAGMRGRLPEMEVVASPEVARWVRDADEEAMSLPIGKRADFYPQDFRFEPCPVDVEVREGVRLPLGGTEISVLETPGHADGHVGFLLELGGRTVFLGGDLVFHGGLVSLASTWDCRIQEYAASMGKLRGAAIDVLLPGHHDVSLRHGQRHVDAANRLFERGFVPQSVV
jgi:hydroxyacylglutathione hydrolase